MNLKININRLNPRIDIRKLLVLEKSKVVFFLFCMSMLVMYLGSLHPWFMWPLKDYYKAIAGMLAFFTLLLDNSNSQLLLSRKGIGTATIVLFFASYLILLVNEYPPGAYIIELFTLTVMFMMLRAERQTLRRFIDFVCKFMAVLLAVSMLFFFLYLVGFGLRSTDAVFGDGQYSYSNYFFFMIDDRFITSIIPRFSSVFLEPGHIGSATSLLLMTQVGRWKKWYNVVLWIATLITFSLAAYVFMFVIVIMGMWVQRKNILGKLVLVGIGLALSVTAAFFYNDGDNLVHDLILLRLEVNEDTGDIEGNNRVSEDFEKEYENYLTSVDILTGRDFIQVNDAHGNSGYRVFIYENGIIVTILVLLFYILTYKDFSDRRCLALSVVMALLIFWVRGYPLWMSNFVPLLQTALDVWKPQNAEEEV